MARSQRHKYLIVLQLHSIAIVVLSETKKTKSITNYVHFFSSVPYTNIIFKLRKWYNGKSILEVAVNQITKRQRKVPSIDETNKENDHNINTFHNVLFVVVKWYMYNSIASKATQQVSQSVVWRIGRNSVRAR